MELYRISRDKYTRTLEASGRANRWNTDKQYVIYAASSRSLAALELLAHRNAIMEGIKYKMMIIDIPDHKSFVRPADTKILVPNWQLLENRSITQKIGSDWYSNYRSAVLKVPSAIIQKESNYILNITHPDFSKIEIQNIEDFIWDNRLL